METPNKKLIGCGAALVVGLFLLLIVRAMLSSFGGTGYFNHEVKSDEVGLLFRGNSVQRVLGPGVYTDMTPFQFLGITNIKVSGIPFTVEDDEVLTADRQRIGILVQGTVLRPGTAQADQLLNDWARYRQFYTDDSSLVGTDVKSADGKSTTHTPGLIQNLGKQAAKVCVGDKKFDDAIVGSARDAMKDCIDKELTNLANGYGLSVQNVVVPNFVLSPDVQKQLDATTAARLAVDVAKQQALQKTAEADRQVQETEGAIRVEQSKVQEQARQQSVTAGLATDAAKAKQAQIEAEKANDLLAAQKDKDIQAAQALAALEAAKAKNADTSYVASLYQADPVWAHYQETAKVADAYKQTDKVLLPAGTNPNVILGNGQTPVIVNGK